MSEDRNLLTDSAAKVFRDLPADFAQGWARVEDAGFALILVPEADGGFGGGWQDVDAVLRVGAIAHLPLAETIVANGFAAGEGPAAICAAAEGELSGGKFSGVVRAVAFAPQCDRILVQREREVFFLPRAAATVVRDYRSLAHEPRADLKFAQTPARLANRNASVDVLHLGALARTCQIAGALEVVLAMTIEHAKTRQQFGRAIGNFQAIQQQLAVFASETAAVGAAAASACRAVDRGLGEFEIASAKLRANRAVDIATSAAHQIHGAIGITAEHALHRYTQHLWAWKSEYGNDRFWAEKLGGGIADAGADAFWPALTAQH
ncbi:MAG: acyl-CoA dehydrogenase family protein [Rhizomicrobium sp.]